MIGWETRGSSRGERIIRVSWRTKGRRGRLDDARPPTMVMRWQQGDETMYEETKIQERFANRSDETVREALNSWWELGGARLSSRLVGPPRPV